MQDGSWNKQGYLEWNPREWNFYCRLCNYNKAVRADKAHVESDKHQSRLLWKL